MCQAGYDPTGTDLEHGVPEVVERVPAPKPQAACGLQGRMSAAAASVDFG